MFTHLLDAVLHGPASRCAHEKQTELLAKKTEELASLRFSIILTAKWAASAEVDAERRHEVRSELEGLRESYSQKIDEIAMTFGVRNAMQAKEEVERTVALPLGMKPPLASSEDDPFHFRDEALRRGHETDD